MRGWHGIVLSLVIFSSALPGCGDSGSQAKAKVEKPKPLAPGSVDADAPEEFTTTESGLKYRIRRKSDGAKPTIDKNVLVHYRGWLDDGTIFDTTYGTGGAPSTLEVSHTVPGWSEGLQLVGVGGMIELEVPAKLGYGEAGSPPQIPPNATLHFLVELINITDPPAAPDMPNYESNTGGLEPGKADDNAPEEFTTTNSGLKYRIRRKSDGPKPTPAKTVVVHYRGSLDNGKVFDSSYSRKEPAEFRLSDVVPGWTEGLQLIGTGGMIDLEIPSELGYGPAGRPPAIPPNSTLHFTVELLQIK